MSFEAIILDRINEKYKTINYLETYSILPQNITKNTIINFTFENQIINNGFIIENDKIKFPQNGVFVIDLTLNIKVSSATQGADIFYFIKKNGSVEGTGNSVTLFTGSSIYNCQSKK